MKDYFLTRETELIRDLDSLTDRKAIVDRILLFLIEVRSSLTDRVEHWIKKGLSYCREIDYERGLFALYVHMAYYLLMNSDYILGKSYLEKASQIDYSSLIDSREHMYFYHAHGLYYHFTGDYDQATEYFEKSLELARKLGDRDFTCQMLNNTSYGHVRKGDLKLAENQLLEAFSIIDPERNPFSVLKIMDNLGYIYIRRGEYDRAIDYLDSAFSYAGDRKIDYMFPPLYFHYGHVYEKKGDVEKAESYYRKAYEENGDTFFTEEIPLGYIRFLFSLGRKEEGERITDEVIELFRRKGLISSLDKVYHLMDEYDI
ncbi:MAG: tetratricopeptide repeat protein [Spirochaetales bacterium]|nr:tetratricopeptide repeat protein [Spirochaetales bacterium]